MLVVTGPRVLFLPKPITRYLTWLFPSNPRTGMVDYSDPVTIFREGSAYVFPSGAGICSPTNRSVFSTAALVNFWHVVDGIFMYVNLPVLAASTSSLNVTLNHI